MIALRILTGLGRIGAMALFVLGIVLTCWNSNKPTSYGFTSLGACGCRVWICGIWSAFRCFFTVLGKIEEHCYCTIGQYIQIDADFLKVPQKGPFVTFFWSRCVLQLLFLKLLWENLVSRGGQVCVYAAGHRAAMCMVESGSGRGIWLQLRRHWSSRGGRAPFLGYVE